MREDKEISQRCIIEDKISIQENLVFKLERCNMPEQILFRGRVKYVNDPSGMRSPYNRGAPCIVTTNEVQIGGDDAITVSIDDVRYTELAEPNQEFCVYFDTRINYWLVYFNTKQECQSFHNAVKRAANF